MRDLIFACLLGSGEAERDALRLARSIRTFGGKFCFNPIWMFSQRGEDDLAEVTRQELFSLGVQLVTFEMDQAAGSFPFASYVTAAGMVESLAQSETAILAFMAADTLVLQEPREFLLMPGKSLGCCPVHLKLLGSGANEPVNDFWKRIYQNCRVDPQQVFVMQTIVDEQTIRAYFNAGLLVVRPGRGLLRAWQARFFDIYRLPEFEAFYQQHELYEIFMHQAVLAGTVLSAFKPEEVQLFPSEINYPLHLHDRVARSGRPTNLDQLITCRYEDYGEFFGNPDLDAVIHIEPSMKNWLLSQLGSFR